MFVPPRNLWIDQAKGLACLLIVAHHLAFYGPMADQVWPAVPAFMNWLYEYARMAVQIFLVLGGYLCAAALAPSGHMAPRKPLLPLLLKRYLRLSLPFCVALLVAILVNEGVRAAGFVHDSVSAEPSVVQVLAHLLLLHTLGGWESLSAGVWYVAIDFQLYALCAGWLWLAHALSADHGPSRLAQAGVVVATCLSLWHWNRDADLDVWAIYFVGAYGLGMMAWWAGHAPEQRERHRWVGAIAFATGLALCLEWRTRIALAGVGALVLATSRDWPWPARLRAWRWSPLAWLGTRSYSVFLIHFPMCLLVNAVWAALWPQGVLTNALGLGVAIALSVAAGQVLYQTVESRSISWRKLLGWQMGALGLGALAMTNWL
ncbi:hypothetical protein CCO03_07795 [Comamonas serinivorans]|uniref:Acyltransferase 3 domain-containing protein n=1 Tax=Comamonas serinivorans TaxID=1082851 RepID=A0A1Y0EMH0_9BURK|nr:acyltransferase family protein [Comamonas serinivorans]ARU04588.1 hypothetical protein CCO03_07795 [Comamonas serinivorans]